MPELIQETVHITLNGEPTRRQPGTTLRELVAEVIGRPVAEDGTAADGGRLGVAVAVADAVVPRGSWAATVLADGDRIDLVTAVQGG